MLTSFPSELRNTNNPEVSDIQIMSPKGIICSIPDGTSYCQLSESWKDWIWPVVDAAITFSPKVIIEIIAESNLASCRRVSASKICILPSMEPTAKRELPSIQEDNISSSISIWAKPSIVGKPSTFTASTLSKWFSHCRVDGRCNISKI